MVVKMKNHKIIIFTIIGFILVLAILIPLGFASAPDSSEVLMTNNSNNATGVTLKDAIDELNYYADNDCPIGYTCKSNTPKCIRATTLHTETCSQTSSYCAGAGYSNGATITYGNTTTIEGVLTTGDVFDCDVDGTGYNHRFYYVSDYYDTSTKNFNDKVAVLIYYSNVRGGVANNAGTAYDCTNQNYNGPVTAREQLPTTTQWSNIRLYKDTRQILAETNATSTTGGTLPSAFSYAGYAARLLTYQEVWNGCYSYDKGLVSTGGLNAKCQFLMEATKFSNSSLTTYGSWLESPSASYSIFAYYVSANYRDLNNNDFVLSSNYGARPTIEILKSEISY